MTYENKKVILIEHLPELIAAQKDGDGPMDLLLIYFPNCYSSRITISSLRVEYVPKDEYVDG